MVGYKNFKAKKYINLVVAKIQEPKFNHFKFFQISPSETAVIVWSYLTFIKDFVL